MAEMNSKRSMSSIKRLVSATSRLLVPPQTLPARSAAARQPWQLGQHFSTRSLNLSPTQVASVDDAATSNDDNNSRIIETELRAEAEKSYLAYAMSVIVGRALPDVRDGLKPVHRRILYAMHELGMSHSKPFRKCARVVGEVLGKYHPHGDSAVYDALVRLAQDFSMQTPLIDGHGNFGSIDDDPAAAMRFVLVIYKFLRHTLFSS
jgi:DNA gyrase subunit A